jgi:capsular polysaccharide biosynthesis protein
MQKIVKIGLIIFGAALILFSAKYIFQNYYKIYVSPVEKNAPKLQAETLEYNFGDIPQQKVSRVLRVKNIGIQPLEIKNVSTSCGCTTASIDKTTIAPNETANLTIAFDPNLMGEIGPVEKVVYIRSNDPLNEEVAITIKMNVVPEKSPSPSPTSIPKNFFKCPPTGIYINCMPPITEERQSICGGEYYGWIKTNCPDVKFTY